MSKNKMDQVVYCAFIRREIDENFNSVVPTIEYISSWKNETDEERIRNKMLSKRKEELLGQSIEI